MWEKLLDPWVLFGFFAQGLFMGRFVLQWIASEQRGRSHVPVGFWWLSLAGGLGLFVYALKQGDPVFVFGQLLGCVIYLRNLWLIYGRVFRGRRLRALRRGEEARGLDARVEPSGVP